MCLRRYKDRNRIERMVGVIKNQQRIASRYDKTTLSFASFLDLDAASLEAVMELRRAQRPASS